MDRICDDCFRQASYEEKTIGTVAFREETLCANAKCKQLILAGRGHAVVLRQHKYEQLLVRGLLGGVKDILPIRGPIGEHDLIEGAAVLLVFDDETVITIHTNPETITKVLETMDRQKVVQQARAVTAPESDHGSPQ